ncbi:ABC-F family ATP-binding cassette domain-containing protein [Devriesea agamarum]|uniref:ABC-F family ATP-binding cassette domain-containing protein n=1 Tax=Devriesea agamarum TaxID=472569 RepID=UPI00071E505D|nr:ATP-binding cassette domain-containing protein [Devriesea agamarum]
MGHIDVSGVYFTLPDGRVLLRDVSFRVGSGDKVALVGANGSGKTTLLRLVAGDLSPNQGTITRSGNVLFMRQMVGTHLQPDATVTDLFLSLAPARIQRLSHAIDACELELMENGESDALQIKYAALLSDFSDAGGYELEVLWDKCSTAALSLGYDRTKHRLLSTLSGGEQKRLVLEYLFTCPEPVLLLDEPDNFLDVPGKIWLENQIKASEKTVLFISHDRELLTNTANKIVSVELGSSGNLSWTHPGGFATFHQARTERFSRLLEQRKRWDEEHEKLRAQMLMYKQKAAYNAGMASRYQAAVTRLRKFEDAGPPTEQPKQQRVAMRLTGGRTAKRALVCKKLTLTGLTKPFDVEVWYGERVALLGRNGTGKSHFLRLIAAGGSDPEPQHEPVGDFVLEPVQHSGVAKLGARVRPGLFVQTHAHPELMGRTLLDILHRGDRHRTGLDRGQASSALNRYSLVSAAEQHFESLSGGQQARFQVLLLELAGATMLLLDEPTDNLDIQSCEALEEGLERFQGSIIAVTHDRWFARSFDRYLEIGEDGSVTELSEPAW